jgi:hypothetical protein
MYTFLGDLQLSALSDLDRLDRLVARTLGHVLNLVDDFVALEDFTENDVAAVEPAGHNGSDEELGAAEVSVCSYSCSCSFQYATYPLVSFPELAMLRRPLRVCLSLKFSSGNFSP